MIPHASPEFAEAFALASAIAFPGMHVKSDTLPGPVARNLLDVRIAALAMKIMDWPEARRLEEFDKAKAEYLAESATHMRAIREELKARREPVASKFDPALLAKINISL